MLLVCPAVPGQGAVAYQAVQLNATVTPPLPRRTKQAHKSAAVVMHQTSSGLLEAMEAIDMTAVLQDMEGLERHLHPRLLRDLLREGLGAMVAWVPPLKTPIATHCSLEHGNDTLDRPLKKHKVVPVAHTAAAATANNAS